MKYRSNINIKLIISKICNIISIALIPTIAFYLWIFVQGFREYGIRDMGMYLTYGLAVLLLVSLYVIVFFAKEEKITVAVCASMVIIQAFMGYYGFIAPQKDLAVECQAVMLEKDEEVKHSFDLPTADLSIRTKDVDGMLNANYPFVTETSGLNNWSWGTSNDLRSVISRMGYATSYTRLLETGGTAFSDALLRMQTAVSNRDLNSDLYTQIQEKNGTKLYSFDHTLPFGIILKCDPVRFEEDLKGAGSYPEFTNTVYRAFTGFDDELLTTYPVTSVKETQSDDSQSESLFRSYLSIKDRSILYIFCSDDAQGTYEFAINGEKVMVPYLTEQDNTYFPVYFNNGMLECGTYENEMLDISIRSLSDSTEGLYYAVMPVDKLDRAIETINENSPHLETHFGKASLSMYTDSSRSGRLFIPVGYNSSWKLKINGKNATPGSMMSGAFLAVDIKEGQNFIEFRYVPTGLLPGVFASVLGIGILILIIKYYDRIRSFTADKARFGSVIYYAGAAVFAAVIILFYVIPIAKWISMEVRVFSMFRQFIT